MTYFNTTIRVANIPVHPYSFMEPDGPVWGFTASRLGNITQSLGIRFFRANLRLEWVLPDDMAYGDVTENGTWTGQFGAVMSGKADMIQGPMPKSEIVDGKFHSSDIMLYQDLMIFGAIPSVYLPQNVSFNLFDLETGIAFLCSLVLSTVLAMTFRKIENSFEGKNVPFWSAEILMGYVKTITQEGTRVVGGAWTNRIIFGFWMVASFFFMTMLTGSLKTGLLVQVPYPRLRDMLDIVARPKLKPIIAHVVHMALEKFPQERYQLLVNQSRETDAILEPWKLTWLSTWHEIATGKAVLLTTEFQVLSNVPTHCPQLGIYIYMCKTPVYSLELVWYYSDAVRLEIRKAINTRFDDLERLPHIRQIEKYHCGFSTTIFFLTSAHIVDCFSLTTFNCFAQHRILWLHAVLFAEVHEMVDHEPKRK